jgi:hypothetical protein
MIPFVVDSSILNFHCRYGDKETVYMEVDFYPRYIVLIFFSFSITYFV